MTLQEGIKQEGRGVVIPHSPRSLLPPFLADLNFEVGAEIGVYKAAYTELFCKAGLGMYAIDPWVAYPGAGRTQKVQDRQDFLYGHAKRVLAPYGSLCTIIRKTSAEAMEDFEDGQLDFVYIDGDHSFKYIAEDIVGWSRKVRRGGIVAGHDYFNTGHMGSNVICHVKAIVDAYTSAFEIEPWWLFGELDPALEPNRKERFLSWMWFNK